MVQKFDEDYRRAFTGTLIKLFNRFKEIELITITELNAQIREHTHSIWCFVFRTCAQLKKDLLAAELRFSRLIQALENLSREAYAIPFDTLRMYVNFLSSTPDAINRRYPFSVFTIRKLLGEFQDFRNMLEKQKNRGEIS